MAINKLSEVGFAEDLIRSLVQFGCAESHAKGLYEKTMAELENGLIDTTDEDVLARQLDKAEQYKTDISTYANLRRGIMRKLLDMFPGHDKDMWCQIKHLGVGAMNLFEAYEGSDDDVELLNMAYEANKAFVSALSRFLGIEWTDCAACFSDAMKGVNEQ